jgi:hypothetical protein
LSQGKRREDRLDARGIGLWIRSQDGAVICGVNNISRTGIALRLDSEAELEGIPPIHIGTVMRANLRIADANFSVNLRVMRVSSNQIGCSLEFPDTATQVSLNSVLSPRFVAKSLSPIRSEVLGSHLRYAYFGADFFFIAFKDAGKFQISAAGIDFVIEGTDVNIYVRRSMDAQGLGESDELESYELLPHEQAALPETITWMRAVLESWEDRPEDSVSIIGLLKDYHAG